MTDDVTTLIVNLLAAASDTSVHTQKPSSQVGEAGLSNLKLHSKLTPFFGNAMLFYRTGRRKRALTCILFLSLFSPVLAIWPFPPKRFTGNALLGAGSMGIKGDGRIIAFGDFNGDQLCVSMFFAYRLTAF